MKQALPLLLVSLFMVPAFDAAAQADACAGAVVIACGGTATGNTSLAAYTADVAPTCTGVVNGAGAGVWYQIVGNGNVITASLCGSSYDTRLRLYSGTCAALVCVVGNENYCGNQSQVTWPSTNATTYFILVHGNGAPEGVYTLTITCGGKDQCNLPVGSPAPPLLTCGGSYSGYTDALAGNFSPVSLNTR